VMIMMNVLLIDVIIVLNVHTILVHLAVSFTGTSNVMMVINVRLMCIPIITLVPENLLKILAILLLVA